MCVFLVWLPTWFRWVLTHSHCLVIRILLVSSVHSVAMSCAVCCGCNRWPLHDPHIQHKLYNTRDLVIDLCVANKMCASHLVEEDFGLWVYYFNASLQCCYLSLWLLFVSFSILHLCVHLIYVHNYTHTHIYIYIWCVSHPDINT